MRQASSRPVNTSGTTTPVGDDVLLTPKQVAAMLGLRDSTLTNWRALYGQTQLPFIKLNFREVRYRRSAVLAFIDEREASTPARMGRPTAEGDQ